MNKEALRLCRRAAAFTLIEMLVIVAIIAALGALLLPSLIGAKRQSQSARCISNLRQLGLGSRMYFDDHEGLAFPYKFYPTNGGVLYWFGWMQNGADGSRDFDARQGVLYNYLNGLGVEICPSLGYGGPNFKYKARGAAYGYGYNIYLSTNGAGVALNVDAVAAPSGIALFADAAQINDFLAPASPTHPLLEEFFYVDAEPGGYPNGHFRHQQRANAVFLDGHVEAQSAEPGTQDRKLPASGVARLQRSILKPSP